MARTNLVNRNGIWIFRKEVDGRDVRISTGFRDLKAAERRAAEIKVGLLSQRLGWNRTTVTVGGWADEYQGSYSTRKRHPKRDRQILSHVLPAWGRRLIDSISRKDCEEYVGRRSAEGAKPATVMREMGLLKAMFGAAVSDRVIERNPWKGVKRLRTEARTRVLQPDEQRRLFDQFNDEYRRAFTAYLGTGLRSQELLALRRQDVQNGSILVSAQSAKFGKRRVVLPLRPEVAEAIEQQDRAKGRSRDERLWQQSGGAVRKYLRKSCERAQVEHLSVHDLRRTFATRCAVSGMPMATLRDIMGHSSMEVTAKYYVHLRQQDLTDALAQVDLNLPRPGTSPGTFAASESEVVRLQGVQEG